VEELQHVGGAEKVGRIDPKGRGKFAMNTNDWKELVAGLPCVATFLTQGKRVYGCEVHHLESVRDNLSEWLVVPLTPEMHRGPNGLHGLSRRGFYTRYKLDDLALMAGTIQLALQTLELRHHGDIAIRDALIQETISPEKL